MTTLDFSHLSSEERLDLIGELWESLDGDAAPVQKTEIARRLETLDADMAQGRDADEMLADLRNRRVNRT